MCFQRYINRFCNSDKNHAESNETIKWEDGNEYPLIKMEFHLILILLYGKTKLVDTAGRIDKFKPSIKALKNNLKVLL